LGGTATIVFSKLFIVSSIFYIIAYAALLVGAIKYNEKAMLVNLVCTAIIPVLGIVYGIITIRSIETKVPELAQNCAAMVDELVELQKTCEEFKSLSIITYAGVYFAGVLINIYVWVCNYSFYKVLKDGNKNPADNADTENADTENDDKKNDLEEVVEEVENIVNECNDDGNDAVNDEDETEDNVNIDDENDNEIDDDESSDD
jgi:hypothetical protein